MINQIFALAILVLGVIMLVTNFQIDNALRGQSCDDTHLNNANKGILVLAVSAIVSSLSYMVCVSRCQGGGQTVFETEMYAGFALLLGIVLVALGSVINNRAGAVTECVRAKHHATVVISLGAIMIVVAGGYLGWYAYENHGGREAMNRAQGYMKAKSGM